MTSLRWNQPICTPGLLSGLKLVVVFELIGIWKVMFRHSLNII